MTTGAVSQTHPTLPPRLYPSPYQHATSAKEFPLLPLLPLPSQPISQVQPVANSTFSKATRSPFTTPLLLPLATPRAPSPTPAHQTTCAPQYYTRPPSAPLRPPRRSPTTSYRQSLSPSARSRHPRPPHLHRSTRHIRWAAPCRAHNRRRSSSSRCSCRRRRRRRTRPPSPTSHNTSSLPPKRPHRPTLRLSGRSKSPKSNVSPGASASANRGPFSRDVVLRRPD